MFKKIAIVGVGLIGGSIGMAVRKKRLAAEVVGVGRRKISIRKAIRKGAIDKGSLDVKRGVRGADLIIIATPADKVMAKIKEAVIHAKEDAIIIDVNSTKKAVVEYADRVMPKGIYFVGTHPLAGLEQSGVLFASPDIFKDTICIITPTRYTKKKALNKIKIFWKRLGAQVKIFSPKEHDRVVANISHLPHILSYSLCNTISPKELKVAGNGFRDTTRIAKSSPEMWSEIFLQNNQNILSSIRNFEDNLLQIKTDIRRKRKEPLLRRLHIAKRKRDSLG